MPLVLFIYLADVLVLDYAVLVIAIHSALQVFRPSNAIRSDGLYPYRYQIYIGGLLIPAGMAALAFVNPRWGYMSQGPFCTLPMRPFWYRLALTWIPRYCIAIVILGLAIGIYARVGWEFRALSESIKGPKTSISTTTPIFSTGSVGNCSVSSPEGTSHHPTYFRRGSSVVSVIGSSRRASAVPSVPDFAHHALPSSAPVPPRTTGTLEKPRSPTQDASLPHSPADGTASPVSSAPDLALHRHITSQRSRIHRQLRLMFIYPIVYVLVWLFPFVNHCFTYADRYAARPVFWLNLVSVLCVTSMGAIDSLVFSLRERPWRHMPACSGTFWGSFAWGCGAPPPSVLGRSRSRGASEVRRAASVQSNANPETPFAQHEGWKGSVMRVGRGVGARTSGGSGGGSDHGKMQAEIARMRLELEKEERRANLLGGGGGGGEEEGGEGTGSAGRRSRRRRRRSTVVSEFLEGEESESVGEDGAGQGQGEKREKEERCIG